MSAILSNVPNILMALDAADALLARAAAYKVTVRDALSENRDLTVLEVQKLREYDDSAAARLDQAIEAAKQREALAKGG